MAVAVGLAQSCLPSQGRKKRQWDFGPGETRSEQVADVLWQLPGMSKRTYRWLSVVP